MAASDGDISDAELRRQLKALGEEPGPITPSTKSLLLRKLKRLQNERGSNATPPKKSSPKRSTIARRSIPATRNQSPSRKLIGFSSDEEDAGPIHSSSLVDDSRARRGEETSFSNVSQRRSRSRSIAPSRRNNLRSRVTTVIDQGSIAVNTLDSTDGIDGEFSDSDAQSYQRPGGRVVGSTDYSRPPVSTKRGRSQDESEGLETTLSSTNGSNKHFSSTESKLSSSLQERHTGAKRAKNSSSWSSIAKILLLISAICIPLLLYATFKGHSSEQMILADLAKLTVCQGNNSLDKYGNKPKHPDCITLTNISKGYVDFLYKRLIIRAGLFECGDPSVESRNISFGELQKQIKQDNPLRNPDDQIQILHTALQLILDNPDWKLRLFNNISERAPNVKSVAWIDTSVSAKPIFCRVNEAVSRLAYLSLLISVAIGGLMIAYFIVRQRWRREEEETRLMYQFVEKIIDILREHHEASKTEKNLLPYLPIPHVRDMLIPPTERQKKFKAWTRAVRFLSANESRIRVESQRIAGEDFEVWRWIHIATPKPHSPKLSLSGTKRGKYWQGQAFENFQSAVNPPVISPTPCLKIRNMFDPDVETEDGWHVMIEDAILEKCIENGAGVVHIAVDKSSSEGCVYVKCDTHSSAGLAFRSLHGCWFDGRLVAVKYLTLKRYHQRFPVALEATERLNPSGSSPSSLVTFDPDEAEDEEDINDSDIEAY